MKILFLAANPVDVFTRLRNDQECREITQSIRLGNGGVRLLLESEWAVRAEDLQELLMTHRPDIVHFSGHCSPSSGIMLEDEDGNRKVVSRETLAELFRILKGNIRLVVLNACYAKEQAEALATTIDFTIGMSAAIKDKDATVFAARFYQCLARGDSVKDAFDLAVNQLKLVSSDVAPVPELLQREGANAAESRIVELSRFAVAFALLPWLLAGLALSLTTDLLRRFLSDGWPDSAASILQSVFLLLAAGAAAIAIVSLVRPVQRLVVKAFSANAKQKIWKGAILTGIALVLALELRLFLPVFARYYNERGAAFQYRERPDLTRARESYQQALRLLPSFAQAHYNLAIVQEDLQPEGAIDEYRLAINYDSHIYPAYNNLARLYLIRGKDDDNENALNLLRQAGDLAPPDDNTQYSLNKNLGWANYTLRHYAMAETYLHRAVALSSQQSGAAAHCLLAYVLKEQGKAGVYDECFSCVSLAPGENGVPAKWVSDAQECLKKGGSK